jgi:hypothetical protein
MNHGIIPVESGGEKDPLNASNPNSSANGPSQVLEGSGKDFGFGMPPYPKGGTLAQKKAWSTIAYAPLVDHYNGNTDKATQAWHDGVGAVDKGAPDSTGYVNKVNANLGQPQAPMHGQSPTEQAAATAEALLPYKQQEQLNQANINVQTEDIKNKNKIQTDLTKTNLEQQAAATSPERVKGRTEFSKLLTDLNGYYNELDKINGAHNSNKGVISNTAASFNTSELGQKLGRAVGSRDQVLRDKIETAKTTLMPLAMKATGMVSQQLNSEMELQNFLKTLTDPSVDVSVAKEQIKRLENLHGVSSVNGAEPSTSKEPTHPGYTGREQMKGGVKYKLRNDGKWEK